jgi:hypothetical protein
MPNAAMSRPRGLGADAAHAHDQRGRVGQVEHAALLAPLRLPLATHLAREVVVKAAREREDERHDVGADHVVVDLAEVRHDHGVRDERGRVVAGGRRGLRRLQPAQPPGLREPRVRDRPVRGVGLADRAQRVGLRLRDDEGELRHRLLQALGPGARLLRLRREHHECRHAPSLLDARARSLV